MKYHLERKLQDVYDSFFVSFSSVRNSRKLMCSCDSDTFDAEVGGLLLYDDWRDIPFDLLQKKNAALSYVDASYFPFLLPAFVCSGIAYWDSDKFGLLDSAVFSLSPYYDYDGNERIIRLYGLHRFGINAVERALHHNPSVYIERYELLDAKMVKSVILLLNCLSDSYFCNCTARFALDSYWSKVAITGNNSTGHPVAGR